MNRTTSPADYWTVSKGPDHELIVTPKNGIYDSCLIFLHGMDEKASTHLARFNSEQSPVPKRCKVILPQAGKVNMTLFGSRYLTNWFDLITWNADEQVMEAQDLEASYEKIRRLIEREASLLDGRYDRIFVGGFSGGAVQSIFVGWKFENRLGGIISFSGYPPPPSVITVPEKTSPHLLVHGNADPWALLEIVQQLYTAYGLLGKPNVQMHVVPQMKHEIFPDNLHLLQHFMQSILDKSPPFAFHFQKL